jgi:hypothetical protein
MTSRNKKGSSFLDLLHFNNEDLEYNRRGILSQRQKKRLMNGAKALLVIMITLLAVISAGVAAVNDGPVTITQYLAAGIVWFLLLSFGIIYYFKTRKGVMKNRVIRATGKVSFKTITTRHISQDYLMVEGYDISLACPKGGENALSPLKVYNVYYLETIGGEILLIEEAPQ